MRPAPPMLLEQIQAVVDADGSDLGRGLGFGMHQTHTLLGLIHPPNLLPITPSSKLFNPLPTFHLSCSAPCARLTCPGEPPLVHAGRLWPASCPATKHFTMLLQHPAPAECMFCCHRIWIGLSHKAKSFTTLYQTHPLTMLHQ